MVMRQLYIKDILAIYRQQRKEGAYLFSDIKPEYYEKLGFKAISIEQPYGDTCCMVNVFNENESLYNHAPRYF